MVSTVESHATGDRANEIGEDAIAISILEEIAAVRDTDPTAIDLQLADYVDLEALDSMYRHSSANEETTWQVQFCVEELEILVESDGRVTVL